MVEPLRLRVTADVEGWPMVRGRYGRLEYHDGVVVSVFTDHRLIRSRLLELPGSRRAQEGDDELRVVVPVSSLAAAGKSILASRRRTLAPEQRAKLRAASLAWRYGS